MISDKLFNELKENAISIWQEYDDTHGYASEKIAMVNGVPGNVGDNYGAFIGMLDHHNQRKLYDMSSPGAQALIDSWVGGLERIEKLASEMGL